MTEQAPGPPCDICHAEEAIGSLMQFGSWETTRFGPGCAVDYLRAIADVIAGVPLEGDTPDEPDQPGPDPYEAHAGSEPADPAPDQDPDEPGSAEDHWASTKHVVRSTHGHRGGRARPESEE